MKWTNEFSIGIRQIDEQHRELSNCVSSLEAAIAGGNPSLAVDLALVTLTDFARIHFAVEETLMSVHEFPGLEEHIHEHWRFAEDLKRFREKALRSDISQEVVLFIRDWLDKHVVNSDKQYAVYILKRFALSR